MDGSTAIWLGIILSSPITFVPNAALLRLLHSRRRAWYPLDILIVSLLVAQLCCTILTFGFSIAALIRYAGLGYNLFFQGNRTPLCAVLISGWTAAHTLHAATLTSLAVDRAFTVRWPYKYRLSVRRTQIRYHVVVLAVSSILVGIAALFANSNSSFNTLTHNQLKRPLTDIVQNSHDPQSNLSDRNETLSVSLWETTTNAINNSYPFHSDDMLWDEKCTFLPHMFDGRFSLFWLCLHGVLFLTTLGALMVIFITKAMIQCCGASERFGLGSGSDLRTLGNTSDGSSATLPLPLPPPLPRYTPTPVASLANIGRLPSVSSSSPFRGSKQTLLTSDNECHQQNQRDGKTSKKSNEFPPMEITWNRERHCTVAALLLVAYFIYHLPVLVLTVFGTYFTSLLPNWPFSATVLVLGLIQSLLLMVLLVLVDPIIHTWMVNSLKPKARRRHSPGSSETATLDQSIHSIKIADEDNRFRFSQLYPHETTEVKFPITNGSLFAHLMNSSDNNRVKERRTSRLGISAYERHRTAGSSTTSLFPETNPPLSTFMSRSRILRAAATHLQVEPLYADPLPSLETIADFSPPMAIRRHEPLYATVSETLSTCTTLESRKPNANRDVGDSEDEGSATESAGDDFEFHNPRSSQQTLVVHDAVLETPPEVKNPMQFEDIKPRSKVIRSATYRILCNGLNVQCAKRDDSQLPTITTSSESQHGTVTCVTLKIDDEENVSSAVTSLRRSKLLTSLSLNDIDMVGNEDHSSEHVSFQIPSRSDSLFSLYKIDGPYSEDKGKRDDDTADETTDNEGNLSVVENAVKDQPQFETKFHIRSSIELSKVHLNDGRRKKLHRNHSQQQQSTEQNQQHIQGMLHFRKKSLNRSKAAVLQRFQEKCLNHQFPRDHKNSVVSIEALKAALKQSPMSYLDNGEIYPVVHQEKTVFLSEYL